MQKKVIIIGGGLAGISAACLAVQHGYRVDLYDENPSLGGDARSIRAQGFLFDRHPKLFPAPYLLDPLIKSASISDPISSQFQAVSPAAQLLFADGKRMQFGAEQDFSITNRETQGMLTFKADSAFQKLDGILQEIIDASSGKKKNLIEQLSKIRSPILQRQLAPYLQTLSTDPYLQQSLISLSAQTGIMIPNLQVRDLFLPALIRKSGLFFPKQGWDAIIDYFQSYLLGAGVKIFPNTKVVEIFPPQKNTIGIRLADQSQQWADEILNTTSELAPPEMQFSDAQPMMLLHLGIKTMPKLDYLSHHNILMLNGNYKSWNLNKPFSAAWLPDYLYLYNSTITDRQQMPEGKKMISIKVPLPSTSIRLREKEMLRLNLLNTLEGTYLPGLKQNIEMEYTEIIESINPNLKTNPHNLRGIPYPMANTNSAKLIHLNHYYENRRPTIPAILFAVQRWIETRFSSS